MPSVISGFCPGFAGILRDGSPRDSRCLRWSSPDNEEQPTSRDTATVPKLLNFDSDASLSRTVRAL